MLGFLLIIIIGLVGLLLLTFRLLLVLHGVWHLIVVLDDYRLPLVLHLVLASRTLLFLTGIPVSVTLRATHEKGE